jgi:hypothetical protein
LSNNNNVIPFDSDIIISEYHNIDIVVWFFIFAGKEKK